MPRLYRTGDWYWLVGPSPIQVYHSARRLYVALDDTDYLAFVADGNTATVIGTEAELREVLAQSEVRYQSEALPVLEVTRPRLPRARFRLQIATVSIPNAAGTAVPWNNELDDPLNVHNNGQNPDRIVIPETGVWWVYGGARFTSNAVGYRAAQLRIGGAQVVATTSVGAANGRDTEFPVGDFFQANEGDFLRMFLEQNSGGPLDCAARVTGYRFA